MKRLMLVIAVVVAVLVALQFAGPNLRKYADTDRDWHHEMAVMGNDVLVLAKYQPTDMASHAGQVRRMVEPRI